MFYAATLPEDTEDTERIARIQGVTGYTQGYSGQPGTFMFKAGCTFYGPSNQSAVVAFSEPLAQWMPRMGWLVPLVLLLLFLLFLPLVVDSVVSPFVALKIYEPTQLRILQL